MALKLHRYVNAMGKLRQIPFPSPSRQTPLPQHPHISDCMDVNIMQPDLCTYLENIHAMNNLRDYIDIQLLKCTLAD